jgi:hypothetical protein
MNISINNTNAATTISIQIWVAGRDVHQAKQRRQAAQKWMSRLPMTCVASGSGRFFYDLWCGRTGTDPLASEGDCIADAEYQLAVQAGSLTDLAALTHSITQDLENALGFPVAVEVEVVPFDEEMDAPSDSRPERDSDADAIMAVVITRREHATILAALRHLARRGGFENTAEVGIATDMDQWKAMSPDEIDDLGDRFNAGSNTMHKVCRCLGGEG